MTDPFATLGLERTFEIDATRLEARYRELQRLIHPDRHAAASTSEKALSLARATEVNEAYRTLRDETKRAEALLALRGRTLDDASEKADPAFLMEMLELREALGEAREANDAERVQALAARVAEMREHARTELVAAFAANQFADAERALGRLKYFRRFLDEVAREEGIVRREAADGGPGRGQGA